MELLLSLAIVLAGAALVAAWSFRSEARRERRARGGPAPARASSDLISELDRQDPDGRRTRPVRVAVCVLRLASVVGAAAGGASEERVKAILDLFVGPRTPPDLLPIIARAAAEARSGVDVDATVAELKRWTDLAQRRALVGALEQVASRGGEPRPAAQKVLVALMVGLGLPGAEVEAYIDRVAGAAVEPPPPDPTETVH